MKLWVGKWEMEEEECKGAMTERNRGNETQSGKNRCWSFLYLLCILVLTL